MSDQINLFNVIKGVINELQNHDNIVIDEVLINPPANEEDISSEKKLPELIKDLFREANGIVVQWHAKSDPFVKGGITIPLLENVHNTRWSSFGVLDYTDDVHAVFQKKSGYDSRVLAESLQGDEDIEFQEIAGGILTIESYFNAFAKTRGFRFWQENYNPEVEYTINSIIDNRGYLWGSESDTYVPELHEAHVPN